MFLLLVLFYFWSIPAHGNPWPLHVDTAITTLTTVFTTTGTWQITGPTKIICIQVDNNTTGELEVNCAGTGATPSNNAPNSFYVAAQTTFSSPPNANLGTVCFTRARDSNQTSGVVDETAWGN